MGGTNAAKPRPLGRVARQEVRDADCDLAAADVQLRPLDAGDYAEKEIRVARARHRLSEARRRLASLLGLGVDASENGSDK